MVAGNMAQSASTPTTCRATSGLYSGVNPTAPALLATRLCCTGFETILTAADQIALGKANGGALRRRRVDVAQPGGGLHPPRRLPHGAVEFRTSCGRPPFTDPKTLDGWHRRERGGALRHRPATRSTRFAAQSFARANAAWEAAGSPTR